MVFFSTLKIRLPTPSRDTSIDKNMPLSDKPFPHAMANEVHLDHMKTSTSASVTIVSRETPLPLLHSPPRQARRPLSSSILHSHHSLSRPPQVLSHRAEFGGAPHPSEQRDCSGGKSAVCGRDVEGVELSPTTIFPLVVQGGLKAEQQYGTHCCFLLKNLQFYAHQFITDFTTTSRKRHLMRATLLWVALAHLPFRHRTQSFP